MLPIQLRMPQLSDGVALNQLVMASPPLDANSVYCNLLQCSHFANTGIAAEHNGELVGFVSGYLLPSQPHIWFVWQMAVAVSARGQGLAKKMLLEVLARKYMANVTHIQTSITPDNRASHRTFSRLAKELKCSIKEDSWLESKAHFAELHDAEHLIEIGPFTYQ